MKRLLRWVARIGAGLLAVAAGLMLAGLDGVDWRPYMKEPYYAATMGRIKAMAARSAVAPAELHAGFGRTKLTPTVNAAADDPAKGQFRRMSLAGFGSRQGKPATGTHDELEVKAVALRAGGQVQVMVGVDALIVPAEVTDLAMEQLARESKLGRPQVYLSATHTHASLGGWGEGMVAELFAGPYQPGARVWFAACIVKAVQAAVADLRPASLGQGRFSAPEFVKNRLVGAEGKVDPEFSYAVIKQEGGRMAVLGSYAAHATVLSGDVMDFSGDYPGYWQRAVEQATGGMAVFLAGGVASHGPVAGEKGFAGAERMGRMLAERVVARILETTLTRRVRLDAKSVDLVLPELNVRVSDGVRLRPWVAQRLLGARAECVIQAFRLGDVVWVSTPCDFSGELVLGIKDQLRARGADAVVTSFNGGYVGYVIPTRYYHLNGYEPRTMSFHGPNVADYFDETIRTLAAQLLER